MSSYYEVRIPVTTTGTAGAAAGSANSPLLRGEVMAVKVDYNASAPVTTKVDVDEVGGAARKILNKAASATDATHYPRIQAQDTSGANIAGIYDRITLHGRKIKISISLSNELTDAVVVTLLIKEER
jgi:hypothetical protein